MAGIEPQVTTFTGVDPVPFIPEKGGRGKNSSVSEEFRGIGSSERSHAPHYRTNRCHSILARVPVFVSTHETYEALIFSRSRPIPDLRRVSAFVYHFAKVQKNGTAAGIVEGWRGFAETNPATGLK
jgi:hypothetical protein